MLLHAQRAAARCRGDGLCFGDDARRAQALALDGQAARLPVRRGASDSSLATMRLTTHLSRRADVYGALGAIGRMRNDGAAAVARHAGGTAGAGRHRHGVMAGMRHFC